jgi:acetoin utilization deacetylase AcuC-like enzyme
MIGFISHDDCSRHEMGAHHPECPERLAAINDQLIRSGLDLVLRQYDAPYADRKHLVRVHDDDYVDLVLQQDPVDGHVWLDGDTAMNRYSATAALRAAGAAVQAVDLVMSGEQDKVFCCVRPPGHHAERHRAMGFCFFNNIAVAAAHALDEHGLERVALLDFDVHHGNGTEDIFEDDSRTLFCSTFQFPFYPNTGADTVNDHIINVPLPAGSTGAQFRRAVEQHWLQPLDDFRPQLVLISAGFDAHADDDMAHLLLREPDYTWVTEKIREIAERHAAGRIVSTLEGGYNLGALGRSVAAHIKALL